MVGLGLDSDIVFSTFIYDCFWKIGKREEYVCMFMVTCAYDFNMKSSKAYACDDCTTCAISF